MTDDDIELFRKLVGDATPLAAEERAPLAQARPRPRARFTREDEARALAESLDADIEAIEADNGDALRFHRPGVGRRTMRKLARGRFAVQAEIDLHGMTVAEARPRLKDFVEYSSMRGHTCIRVVHGKGRGSGDRGPVLKMAVNRWLRRWEPILAFVSARQADGGTGAIYVLLDRS
ncbi:MAG: Smr/MutS family protein [Pseudomonadota bacterium]